MALSPGGVSASLEAMTQNMRPEEAAALRDYYNERYGLDDPYLVQYFRWLNKVSPVGVWETASAADDGGVGVSIGQTEEGETRLVGFKTPDLGTSYTRGRSVSSIIGDTLPITVILNLLAIPIIYITAIVTGIYAGQHRGRFFDIFSSVILLGLWSIPVMWAGVMLIGLLANQDFLYWFPTGGVHDTLAPQMPFLPRWTDAGFERGWLLDALWHLVLPVVCLAYGGMAFLAKLMRASVLENLSADFVRTARAKGVNEHDILWRHVLRNSLLPLITIAAALLPAMLSGSLIIENIFSINGMGKLMIDAIKQRDREIVLSVTFVVSIISLISLIIRDICYALADPRVSFE